MIRSTFPVRALPTAERVICAECSRAPPPFAATIAALVSAFPIDRPIRRIKCGSDSAALERGFNQATEIAARVATATALSLFAPLERIRAGPPQQAALPWGRRGGDNVRGAFAVRRDVRAASIALVADVMTTGATLAEVSRVPIEAGALRVERWVAARSQRPDGC